MGSVLLWCYGKVSLNVCFKLLFHWLQRFAIWQEFLTHWGRVTYICVGTLNIICSDNGLSPGRRQAIIWTNTGILLIGILGTNFSEIFIEIQAFSFKKMHLKMSFGKWRPSCLGLNVLTHLKFRATGNVGKRLFGLEYFDRSHHYLFHRISIPDAES